MIESLTRQENPAVIKSPILEVEKLEKEFDRHRVLRGLSFRVLPGEKIYLIGPNGSGKSTLLHIISGISQASAGKLKLFGLDFPAKGNSVRERILFISHETFFYLNMSALENLEFFYRMVSANNRSEKLLQKSEIKNLMEKSLNRVSLYHDRHKKIEELSLGMRHRLSIARLLLVNPKLIIMDEPNTGLDKRGVELLDSIITEKAENGATVIEATHRLEWAMQMLRQSQESSSNNVVRILALKKGQLFFDSQTDDIGFLNEL